MSQETYPFTSCAGPTSRKKYKVPEAAKKAAEMGLKMHSSGFKGGTKTGWSRARQLIKCDYVSDRTIKTMKAWFARHTLVSYPGYQKWARNGKPTQVTRENKAIYRGAVAWLIWGGDPAKKWLEEIVL